MKTCDCYGVGAPLVGARNKRAGTRPAPAILFLCALLFSFPAHADITTGLVGWWRMDEGSGLIALDSSGRNNTGTLQPTGTEPLWVDGKLNGALSLNGLRQYVSVNNASSLKFSGNSISISLWASINSLPPVNRWHNFVIKGLSNINNYQFAIANTGALAFDFGADPAWNTQYCSGGAVPTGAWYHFAVTYNGVNVIFYRDGVQWGVSRALSVNLTDNNSNPLTIGAASNDQSSVGINGLMDDVRIYNRALTAGDVLELYNNGGPSSFKGATIRNAVIK